MSTRRYKDVAEMLGELTDNQGFRDSVRAKIASKRLSKTLFGIRCAGNKTQADMAKALGCTQGRISKLENAEDARLVVGDLVAYARALQLTMTIAFHKEMTAVESVKHHVFEIKKHLDHLADLAHRDDDIFEGVKSFYAEYLYNVIALFEKSAQKLPRGKKPSQPTLRVSAPMVDEREVVCSNT